MAGKSDSSEYFATVESYWVAERTFGGTAVSSATRLLLSSATRFLLRSGHPISDELSRDFLRAGLAGACADAGGEGELRGVRYG